VIGVVGSARKRDAAIEAGCDDVVLQEGFEKSVMQLTREQGVDLVLESVGGESLRASLRVLAPLGRVVTFGNASAAEPNAVSAFDLWFQARGVQGYNIAHLAAAHPGRWQKAAGEAIGYVARAAVRLRPSAVFPLADAARAHEAIESRQATGKLVLSVGA
jgi:NADPH:quinone reductase